MTYFQKNQHGNSSPNKLVSKKKAYLSTEEDVEGHAECDDKDWEDYDNLNQSLEDLEEHHHINTEHVEPMVEKIKR